MRCVLEVVLLITPQPTVTKAEVDIISKFHSSFPQVNRVQFHLLPFHDNAAATTNTSVDPFYQQFTSIVALHTFYPLFLLHFHHLYLHSFMTWHWFHLFFLLLKPFVLLIISCSLLRPPCSRSSLTFPHWLLLLHRFLKSM